MSTSGFWQFMDLAILAVGVYGLYAAWVLKNQGKIVKLFLTFKETDIGACKDLQGICKLYESQAFNLCGCDASLRGDLHTEFLCD